VFQVLMPGVTLAVTAFLPASVQVSFFVSGMLALVQATLLRRPAVRKFFKLYPIKTVRDTATGPSPEAINVRVPPTQAQLNSSYKQTHPVAPQSGEDGVVKRFVKSTVQGATKDIRTTISEAVKSGREIAGQGKEGMAKRQAKADRAAAAAYEAKRQKEILAERRQREEDRRARRAARDRRS
jgi:YidC/Oxa1 family membrane protein insertase